MSLPKIERGAQLPQVLEPLLEEGLLPLFGILTQIKLQAGPESAPWILNGPCFFRGEAWRREDSIELFGLLSWSDQGLPRSLSGLLLSAEVKHLELLQGPTQFSQMSPAQSKVSIESEAPKRSRASNKHKASKRSRAEAPPPQRREPQPKQSEARSLGAPSPSGWAAAVELSKKSVSRPSPDDLGFELEVSPRLRRGDILIHPRFGRCKVVQEVTRDKVKVRRATGGLIDLALRYCRFSQLTDEEGGRVYRLRISKRS